MNGDVRILRCQGQTCGLIRPCLPFQTDDGVQWLCVDCCPWEFEEQPTDAGGSTRQVATDGGDR